MTPPSIHVYSETFSELSLRETQFHLLESVVFHSAKQLHVNSFLLSILLSTSIPFLFSEVTLLITALMTNQTLLVSMAREHCFSSRLFIFIFLLKICLRESSIVFKWLTRSFHPLLLEQCCLQSVPSSITHH